MVAESVVAWLLDSDPALRWQVEGDVVGEPPQVWEATRARTATERFGARLLALQEADGQGRAPRSSQPTSTSTVPRLQQELSPGLRQPGPFTRCGRGIAAEVLRERRTVELLAANSRWEYENRPYWRGEVDCCINAWTVANGVWLGADITRIVDSDGGWNSEWVEGSTRSSFHSTLNSLKGLLAHDAAAGGSSATHDARRAALRRGILPQRKLFRRPSTSEPVGPWVDRFAYPCPDACGSRSTRRRASRRNGSRSRRHEC